MTGDRLTVVLDANVLYPFLVRDVLLSLAQAGLVRARWTDRINEEWSRALLARKPERSREIRRTLVVMDEAFPDSLVTGYEHLMAALVLPDADDRHVLAAAVHTGARRIVTENLADFPREALAPFGIEPQAPDDLVLEIVRQRPTEAIAALHRQRCRYKAPPIDPPEFVAALGRIGMPRTAAALRLHIGDL